MVVFIHYEQKISTIHHLPSELYTAHIFQYFDGNELFGILSLVCKYWNHLVMRTRTDIVSSCDHNLDSLIHSCCHLGKFKYIEKCTLHSKNQPEECKRVVEIFNHHHNSLHDDEDNDWNCLRELNLSDFYRLYFEKIDDTLIESISKGTFSKQLTILKLGGNQIEEKGAKLLSGGSFDSLTYLDLNHNMLGVEGMKSLMVGGGLLSVRTLLLKYNHVESEGLRYLLESNMNHITHLNLSCNRIDCKGVKYVSEAKILSGLTFLDLSHNNIGSNGIKSMVESKVMSNLKSLHLEYNSIGNDSLKHIANSSYLNNLKYLNIRCNELDWNIKLPIPLFKLSNLVMLDISHNEILFEIKKSLINNFPNLEKITVDSEPEEWRNKELLEACNTRSINISFFDVW